MKVDVMADVIAFLFKFMDLIWGEWGGTIGVI